MSTRVGGIEFHIASGAVMPNKAKLLEMACFAAATRRNRLLRTGSSACSTGH